MRIIDGVLKEYAWGRIDGLVPWTAATGGPQAELWFGAHPSGPSPIVDGDAAATLADVEELRGVSMVKLLAAALPLSIQIHPDAALAAAGYAAQQADPSASPLFSDAQEKTEMLVALTDFDTHAGWRDRKESVAVLAGAGASRPLLEIVEHGTPAEAVRALFALDDLTRDGILEHLTSAAIRAHWAPDSITALAATLAAFPGDPGGLVTVLLQHHRLTPGQALVVPAGVVHSYVSGLAVEVMTSSDNVLRLGLTSKRIAIDEALDAVRADRVPILREDPSQADSAELPFTVTMLTGPTRMQVATGVPRTVLCLEGDLRCDGVVVAPGRAAVFAAGEPEGLIELSTGRAVLVEGKPAP